MKATVVSRLKKLGVVCAGSALLIAGFSLVNPCQGGDGGGPQTKILAATQKGGDGSDPRKGGDGSDPRNVGGDGSDPRRS